MLDWLQYAACKGKTGPFFSRYADDVALARKLCAGCPVREECLDHAMSDLSLVGLWAGLTADERRAHHWGTAA